MLRKVKSREALLDLFNTEDYAVGEHNQEAYYVLRKNLESYFLPAMFEFCGKELEFSEGGVSYYDLKHGGYGWIEEWLEPISKGVM